MFVEERQALIIEELQEKGRVKVKELSARFKVTADLIRKDLTALEEAGQLKKTYGGAVAIKENVHREMVSQRKTLNLEAKQQIAKSALSLIKDDYIVFLDISTANIELAKLIIQHNIKATIVTNMLDVVNILVKSNVRVIFIGGELDYSRDGFVGSLALEMLKHFRFDVAFMGVVGVDVKDNCVTTYMPDDGITKKEILNISRKSYMMCEYEKLSQLGNYQFAKINDFTGIITNKKLLADDKKILNKYNIDLLESNK